MLRALIFVPRVPDWERWVNECVQYCHDRGYYVVAVVARLEDVPKAAEMHRAVLVVLARRAHLLPQLPLEVVSEQGDPVDGPKRYRRPQRTTWIAPR